MCIYMYYRATLKVMYLTYFFYRKLSYKKIFPPSCFDVDGMVLKPQLRTALQVLGFQMYEEEFDKVWDRYYTVCSFIKSVHCSFIYSVVNVVTYIDTYHKCKSEPVELGMTEKQIQLVVGVALDHRPLDCESDAPTTRPCLACEQALHLGDIVGH